MNPRAARWLACLLVAWLVLGKFSQSTGFTSLIRFGANWQDHRLSPLQSLPLATVPASGGYDGQFYAQIALDPFLRSRELDQAIDAPAYRARRILAPATAALAGLGRPWWTLQAYALLNVLCWFALGLVLHRQIGDDGWVGFARWAGCLFSLGVLDSVRQSLVDLPALLLLVLGVTAYARARLGRSTFWLALANLTKETSLLGAVALHCVKPTHPVASAWKRIALSFMLAALPLALWSLYVQQRFPGPGGDGLGNFTWPLLGLVQEARLSLSHVLQGDLDSRYTFGLIAIVGLLTQAWVLWRHRQPAVPWWRIGAIYSLLLLFLGSWVWSGYWAVCRAVLPMTIAFNLLLPTGRSFWPWWIVGNLTLLHAVWRFL